MKKFLAFTILAFCALFGALPVFADANYPYSNPTYIPSAISPAVNFTAPSTSYTVTLQDRTTLGVEVNGTCTALAATVQVSIDGTTWRTVNVYPVATGTITAAASITAAGAYRANVSGTKIARVNVGTLTASCNVSAVATSGGASLAQ